MRQPRPNRSHRAPCRCGAALEHGWDPLSPTFVDSRAVMVGAGQPFGDRNEFWERASFSPFGARVDCFGPGFFGHEPPNGVSW